MSIIPIWIEGGTRSGKTSALVGEFRRWVLSQRQSGDSLSRARSKLSSLSQTVLVFAANDDNKRELADQLALAVKGSYPILCKTPLGFLTDEVILFWPLIFEFLGLKAQFPRRLRPETEQELATRLWQPAIAKFFQLTSINEYRFVRQVLDLLQLAGASGVPAEKIPERLADGLSETDLKRVLAINEQEIPEKVGELIIQWRDWSLERGLLSYGIIYELYWRYLFPDSRYQQQLLKRFRGVFADDVDDYPAIAKDLLSFFLDHDCFSVFTYNPQGKIRLGLTADPDYLQKLAARCQIMPLSTTDGLAVQFSETVLSLISDGNYLGNLPDQFISLQTTSRAELLRKTATAIIQAVKQGQVKPEEIAVIAPGLDEIARYSLMEILTGAGIAVQPLNEQRPLISCPLIRALLTLLALVYENLGRLAPQEAIAEMLVIFSRYRWDEEENLIPDIDPVRAGLIADHCYQVHPENPRLLAIETFPRWDRLGQKACTTYERICHWIEGMKKQQQEAKLFPIFVLNQAIEQLLNDGENLPFDHLAALRELMETAQHFWEIDRRLRESEPSFQSASETISQFIQLLRRGTITANPYPVRQFIKSSSAVTLGNIFQYRSFRSSHRWHFWLDCSSPLWEQGGAATLFAAPIFWRESPYQRWTTEAELEENQARLQRVLRDLLARVSEKVILCHSDLGVSGTDQTGQLLSLVQAAKEYD
ncbi:MAG: recombinase family protein [Microcystis aeruginosa LG13-11]|nr:recombinase family protein [Microcystis aeruginosa LG13-11]